MPLDIHVLSIDKAQILKINAKLEWYNKIDNKVQAIINTPCTNKTIALELIYDIYNGSNIQTIIDRMNILLRAIRIDQRHDFDDEGNRCSGGIDVNFIPFSLGTIADELKNIYIIPPNSKVELISSQTELTGLKYYCMDIGVRDGNAKKLEETIEKTLNDEIKLNKSVCCSKISTIAQIIDSAGCAYNKENLNSYDAGTCSFCNNEMTMYNIGFIFYQSFFEYFSNKETFFIFEYLNGTGADITNKIALANMNDSTQKKLRLSLYEIGKNTKITSSSCTIGQKGFSVAGICTFLSNDKGMFDKPFVDYIKNTLAGSSGDKEVQRLFKTATCMCVKGYGDFGQLILTSYLNCLQPYINNIILLTCDRFLAYIACILECPFMLGTTIEPCYLYDSSAKLLNKYVVDVWNMSAKNIKIICDPLHNYKKIPLLSNDINALIKAQETHIITERAQNAHSNPIVYIKSKKLLKVDELISQFNDDETRLYRLYCNDYAIIYNNKSGTPCYELYDISTLQHTDVQAFFTNPTANIGNAKFILNDPNFFRNANNNIITNEQYTLVPPFNNINLLRKHIETTTKYYNIFIEIKVFTEGLTAKQGALYEYTGYAGSNDGFTTNLNMFFINKYSMEYGNWSILGYGNKETLENEIKTADGYLKILQHGIENIKKDPLGAFNKFLTNNYKKKNSCSNVLDSPEILLENFPNLCNIYINELKTISTNLEYIITFNSKTFIKDQAIWDNFLIKIVNYYNVIKVAFSYLITTFIETIGELATLTKPYYVFEYYINLFENPDITYITPSMFNLQSELQTKEASIRRILKVLNINNIKLILDFIENINKKYNFVINDVKPLKDILITSIDKLILSANNQKATGGAISKAKGCAKSKAKGVAKSKASLKIHGGMYGHEYMTTYDTNLTELQDQITDNCCATVCCYKPGSNMVYINSDDSDIDLLKYNEYLKELRIILNYLYGSYKNAEEELTLWNVFCYYYYIKINDDINMNQDTSSPYSLLEIKRDVSIWETFKRNYPIYQYIIEHYYFTNNKGLLYKYIRNENVGTSIIETSGETRLIVTRYNKFINLENSISYYIQQYNIFEKEKVDELTKKLTTIQDLKILGNLYGMYDLQIMLERPVIQQSLFGESKNNSNIQVLSRNNLLPYNIEKYDEHLLKDYVFYKGKDKNLDEFVNNLPDEQSDIFLKMCFHDVNDKKGILKYIKNISLDRLIYAIETNVRFLVPHIIDKLSGDQFSEIIKTHLRYIDPSMIYHLTSEQLLIFLNEAPIDTIYVRNYISYASIDTLSPLIKRNPHLIIKLPFSKFEPFIKGDHGYFEYLSEDQRVEFLIANNNYIVFAGDNSNPIGKYIGYEKIRMLLNINPSSIQYLNGFITKWFIVNCKDDIENNNIYIGYITYDQAFLILSELILQFLPKTPYIYILKYIQFEHILKYVKYILNNRVDDRVDDINDEKVKQLFKVFTPEQIVFIIMGLEKNDLMFRSDINKIIGYLEPSTQLMILQKNPKIIANFSDEQIDNLVSLKLITKEQIQNNEIMLSLENGRLFKDLPLNKLIEYTNIEPKLYSILFISELTDIYNDIIKIKNNDIALLKFLYYFNPKYKGEFIQEHPEILEKYHTYIQHLLGSQIYKLFKKSLGNDINAVTKFLDDENKVIAQFNICKKYIQYMTDEQITNIISKRWLSFIGNENDERKIINTYHDKYIHLLFQGISGEQALTLRILDPTHKPKEDSDFSRYTGEEDFVLNKFYPTSKPVKSYYNNIDFDPLFYDPLKYIYYIQGLSEETSEYFIKNLGRDELKREQLINIIKMYPYIQGSYRRNPGLNKLPEISEEFPSILKYCSPEQIKYCFASLNINSDILIRQLNIFEDEQIDVIIKHFLLENLAINHIIYNLADDKIYRFAINNKEFINLLTLDNQYNIVKDDPNNISYIITKNIPDILDKLNSDKRDISDYIDHLDIDELRHLYSIGSNHVKYTIRGSREEILSNKPLQKLLENAIIQLQNDPKYLFTEPDILIHEYLNILKEPKYDHYAGIIYDGIYNYKKSLFYNLNKKHLKPILKLRPNYIRDIEGKYQLYFINKNWMLLQYISVFELQKKMIKREEDYILDFLHKSSDPYDKFKIQKFILMYDCDYERYINFALSVKDKAKFIKKYPDKFFDLESNYNKDELADRNNVYSKIKSEITKLKELVEKSKTTQATPAIPAKKRGVISAFTRDFKGFIGKTVSIHDTISELKSKIFYSLLTVEYIEDIKKLLLNLTQILSKKEILEFIKDHPGYIDYLPYNLIEDIIWKGKEAKYLKYLTVEYIPPLMFTDKTHSKYLTYLTQTQKRIYEKIQKYSKKSPSELSNSRQSSSSSISWLSPPNSPPNTLSHTLPNTSPHTLPNTSPHTHTLPNSPPHLLSHSSPKLTQRQALSIQEQPVLTQEQERERKLELEEMKIVNDLRQHISNNNIAKWSEEATRRVYKKYPGMFDRYFDMFHEEKNSSSLINLIKYERTQYIIELLSIKQFSYMLTENILWLSDYRYINDWLNIISRLSEDKLSLLIKNRPTFFDHYNDDELFVIMKDKPNIWLLLRPKQLSQLLEKDIQYNNPSKFIPAIEGDALKKIESMTEEQIKVIIGYYPNLFSLLKDVKEAIILIKKIPMIFHLFTPLQIKKLLENKVDNVMRSELLKVIDKDPINIIRSLSVEKIIIVSENYPELYSKINEEGLIQLIKEKPFVLEYSHSFPLTKNLLTIIGKKTRLSSPIKTIITGNIKEELLDMLSNQGVKGGNSHIYRKTNIKKNILGKKRSIYKIPKSKKEYILYKGSYIYVKDYIKLYTKTSHKT